MFILTFQIGRERLALDTRLVHEVVPRVPLEPVSGGPAWLAGFFIYRGRVVPVVDLHQVTGAGECPQYLSSRIVLVRYPSQDSQRLLGLLAAQVADLRELPDAMLNGGGGQSARGRVLADGTGVLHLLELDRLLPPEAQAELRTGERVP